VKTKRCIVVVC